MSAIVQRQGVSAWLWGLVWGSWLLLLVQQFTDALLSGVPWIIWCGKLLPLLIFVPGMRKDRLRSFIWLCFMCLLYFMTLVEYLFAAPRSLLGQTGMVAVVVLFIAAMLYVRARGPELRAANQSPQSAEGSS